MASLFDRQQCGPENSRFYCRPCVSLRRREVGAGARHAQARDLPRITSAWDDVAYPPRADGLGPRLSGATRAACAASRWSSKARATSTSTPSRAAMWERIQSLADKDEWRGQPYDHRVSADPEDPHFSLSFGGEAFFVVGLHPNASRARRGASRVRRWCSTCTTSSSACAKRADTSACAKRFSSATASWPATINPMLARHGEASEARQYRGRAVDDDWKLPVPRSARRMSEHRSRLRRAAAPPSGLRAGPDARRSSTPRRQVSDLLAFGAADVREAISNGRTFDYEETIRLTTGNRLWSNRSNPMLEIVEDTVGSHDFLLTPCSEATFRHFYPDQPVHRGCFGNLAEALAPYRRRAGRDPVAFNLFMNVPVAPRRDAAG